MLVNLQKENRSPPVTEDVIENRLHQGRDDGLNPEIEDDLNLGIKGNWRCTREDRQKTGCFQCLETERSGRLLKEESVDLHLRIEDGLHHEIGLNDRPLGIEIEGGQVQRRETETGVVLEVGDAPNHVPEIVDLLPGDEEDVLEVLTNLLEGELFPEIVNRSIEDQLKNLA